MASGSSPLTRGKHRSVSKTLLHRRLIPAHAGKTSPARRASSAMRAHPRSRGENRRRHCLSCGLSGSSPLTRGKRFLYQTYHRKERLIPAHAGKTYTVPSGRAAASAHPRSRGEN